MEVSTRVRCASAAAAMLLSPALHAATFSAASYDPNTNELVVTMIYRGTNPDHRFSIQWSDCQPLGDGGNQHQIAAEVLDGQWDDTERSTFTKTVRFSLANLKCRPATVTLRTAPRFEYTLQIP